MWLILRMPIISTIRKFIKLANARVPAIKANHNENKLPDQFCWGQFWTIRLLMTFFLWIVNFVGKFLGTFIGTVEIA